MSITRDQVIVALDVAQKLRGLGYSVIIAGGFCRDVYFGEPPKDLDIVVAAGPGVTRTSSEIHQDLATDLLGLGVEHLGFRMYSEHASDRLIGGFKCVGNLDVVLYEVKTAPEAVDAFDFNLNQFVLMNDDNFDEAYVVYAGDTSWHELNPVREDFSVDRKGKMHEKFLNLTWRYPEGQGPARAPLTGGIFPN